MEAALAAIILGLPALFVLSILGVQRYKYRKALTGAAEQLGMQIIGSPISVPRIEGDVDGVHVITEQVRPSIKGSLVFALINTIKYGLGGHEGAPSDRHRYDGRFGPIRIAVEPAGLPPELEMLPVEAVGQGELEGPSHTLQGNIERVFDIDATEERFTDAILDNREVMKALWHLHSSFASARCQYGTLEAALISPGSASELADRIRQVVAESKDIEEALANNPIWT